MTYPADYRDAHDRHWKDAELLLAKGRWGNADQLYGFSAECGLKAVMKVGGMRVDERGVPVSSRHRIHVDALWPVFRTFVEGRTVLQYLRFVNATNPFANWSHHNRYANSTNFSRDEVDPHRNGAREICKMIGQVEQDGLL